ncbi:LacI family DNA-binding transcriptional regulator [Actinoplanes sp. NPDC051513]|uniref:LacI family DNA-binding transcriptional regulator n=1 Tax=Actinoplanes sp. NPDC051513 TaxID=3363908 RepID=UPI0037BC3C64
MKHPYRIREIARQAGLSEATVDRVLHGRGGVRESTAREVQQAIAALDREQAQARLAGPAVPVDVVALSPSRFTAALRQAFEAELPDLRPAVIKPRFHVGDQDVVAVLDRVGRSRSQGVILTAPDTPEIAEAVGQIGLPVVTLGVDLPESKRIAYAGISHPDAGATAAYLVEQWLADRAGDVLLTPSSSDLGADERAAGFRAEMAARAPNRRLLESPGPSVRAIYAPAPGGTTAVIETFAAEHRKYDVFVAHGLDASHADLLRAHKLSAVLHEDLRADVRHACLTILRAQGLLSGPVRPSPSAIRVITPFNF